MAAEDRSPEQEDVRRKALLRLGVAGLVTAVALAGLWWLDQDGKKPSVAARPDAIPAPIVPAPPTDVVPPQAEPPVPPATAEGVPPAPPAQPEAPPPPPKVSNLPSPPSPAPTPPRPPAAAPGAPAAKAPATPAPPPAQAEPVPAGKGFVVQLGVFSNPDNARELVERLAKQGIRAQLEARVHLGPFRNRQEAEKAQVEMRRLGYTPLITPASTAK
ncbi:MAG: hypothetical protein FD142_1607 [bacterium]|nr:MAG: hypothetical protein FD142_1607 [bacterium]